MCIIGLIVAIGFLVHAIVMLFVTAADEAKKNRAFYDWMDSRK